MVWILMALGGGVMLVLAVAVAWALGWANEVWRVREDPRVHILWEALPHLDCGGCGLPNCHEYAAALAEGRTVVGKCEPGGAPVAAALAAVLGVDVQKIVPAYAVVHCGATRKDRKGCMSYRGVPTCAAAHITGAVQGCVYGCLGLGDCERACPFDAIHMLDALAVVDYDKCTACGNCVRACPRSILSIETFPADALAVVACGNRDPGKQTRAVCNVGCIDCGLCQKNCRLFKAEGNLSRLDYDRYDSPDAAGLQEAQAKCPTGCLPTRGKTRQFVVRSSKCQWRFPALATNYELRTTNSCVLGADPCRVSTSRRSSRWPARSSGTARSSTPAPPGSPAPSGSGSS